jgi:hypothetical protein
MSLQMKGAVGIYSRQVSYNISMDKFVNTIQGWEGSMLSNRDANLASRSEFVKDGGAGAIACGESKVINRKSSWREIVFKGEEEVSGTGSSEYEGDGR